MSSPAEEQLVVLGRVVGILDRLAIPHMLTGSLAGSYYSQPRLTRDIDLVVDLMPDRVADLATALAPEFYCDEAALARAAEHRTLANVIHDATLLKVDFIVRKDDPYHREEFRRRRRERLGDVVTDLVTPEDLLLAKLAWLGASGSALQRDDARRLLADVPDLDWGYVHDWAGTLGLDALLEEVRR